MTSFSSELGGLADPASHQNPLDVEGASPATLRKYLTDMLTIRMAEEAIGTLVEEGLAKTPCHLAIGQEAVAVGISASLTSNDRVFVGHRSHSHIIAMGGDLYGLIAEILGRASGVSRGMGGSMHLYAPTTGFYGCVPLVGATIPIAVGAALAARMDDKGAIAVSYFGDGAAEEGVLHESLNLAAVHRLPILFVCENNLFSSHLDIFLRQPTDRIARFADAHAIRSLTVDGNDVLAVAAAAASLVAHARAGAGPAFLEAVTYRHRGHVGPNDDIDVGVRRTMDELARWKLRDPIKRLIAGMKARNLIDERELDALQHEIGRKVAEARAKAEAAPYPDSSALLGAVFRSVR
ncbi:MAG: thiamine pyrophosphate-dependent dehydrogenase E1 component subunit alpha [Pseudomonadota bacterium]|nr:thiamine pyrophosphate-dependent dehydrogenase E1 component subunit alpha [Pseudomonadota bacterium]